MTVLKVIYKMNRKQRTNAECNSECGKQLWRTFPNLGGRYYLQKKKKKKNSYQKRFS